MFQIFQPHQECSKPRRILIEGRPGMGKTTYCHKIAYDWAKKRKGGESFPDVTLVLLLKCRDINCGLWEAIDDQLLPREVNEEEKEGFFNFIRDHPSKVLLVLDGLDELPSGQLSIYTDIIQGRVIPECYIVVTARREVGVKVRECCNTLLEVEGFTKTGAKKFIWRYFKEKHLAKKLLHKLDSDRTLRDLTRNPLNTALLCLLFEDLQGKFPESRTLLYLEIVECVLRRYRRKMKITRNRPRPRSIIPSWTEATWPYRHEGFAKRQYVFWPECISGSLKRCKIWPRIFVSGSWTKQTKTKSKLCLPAQKLSRILRSTFSLLSASWWGNLCW